jgi:hypothetical protein
VADDRTIYPIASLTATLLAQAERDKNLEKQLWQQVTSAIQEWRSTNV